jgi:TRAP-type mannitol/chloroaromatic compound transport system permease small subunit
MREFHSETPPAGNASVIARLLFVIDGISKVLAYITMVMVGLLILVMSYEMVVRRILNAPTLWAFDVSYMLSGMIFVMATGFTLLRNEHIRIDFLSTKMPLPAQHAANIAFYVTLFVPALYILSVAATRDTLDAFMTSRVERVSPWSPVIWPYYLGLTVGLWALLLQSVAEVIRHAIKIIAREAAPAAQTPAAEIPALAGKDL